MNDEQRFRRMVLVAQAYIEANDPVSAQSLIQKYTSYFFAKTFPPDAKLDLDLCLAQIFDLDKKYLQAANKFCSVLTNEAYAAIVCPAP